MPTFTPLITFCALLVACSPRDASPGPPDTGVSDGGTPTDGSGLDSTSDGAADASASACTSGDGALYTQCCVWAPAVVCQGTATCAYHWTMTSAEPNDGYCFPLASIAVGQACQVGNGQCVVGAWCAWTIPTDPNGVCRELCQRDDLTTHGCTGGQTCHLMPEHTDGRMGYCAP